MFNLTLAGLALAGIGNGCLLVCDSQKMYDVNRFRLRRFEFPLVYGACLRMKMEGSRFHGFLRGVLQVEEERFSGKYEEKQVFHAQSDVQMKDCMFVKCSSSECGAFSIDNDSKADLRMVSCSFVSCRAKDKGCFMFNGNKLATAACCFGSCAASSVQTFKCDVNSASLSQCWIDQCSHRPETGDNYVFDITAKSVIYENMNISRSAVRNLGCCGVFQASVGLKYQFNCHLNNSGSNFLGFYLGATATQQISSTFFKMCIPYRNQFLSSVFRYQGFIVIKEFVFVLTRMKNLYEQVGDGSIQFVKCATDYSRSSVGEDIKGFSFDNFAPMSLKVTDFLKWQCATSFLKSPPTPSLSPPPTNPENGGSVTKSKKLTISRQVQLLACFVLSVLITVTLHLNLINYRRTHHVSHGEATERLRITDDEAEISESQMLELLL